VKKCEDSSVQKQALNWQWVDCMESWMDTTRISWVSTEWKPINVTIWCVDHLPWQVVIHQAQELGSCTALALYLSAAVNETQLIISK